MFILEQMVSIMNPYRGINHWNKTKHVDTWTRGFLGMKFEPLFTLFTFFWTDVYRIDKSSLNANIKYTE